VVKAESGPDHRKRFLVEVFLPTGEAPAKVLGRGVGGTKKKAEQEAARRALLRLKL
jgi:ribonuclease-3